MSVDIEAEVARFLCEATGADAFLDVPADHPGEMLTVERTGGGGGFLEPVYLDVDCWAPVGKGGRKLAQALAERVKAAVASLEDIPCVFGPEVENAYKNPDPDTGRKRYTVQVTLFVCE